MAGVLLAPGAGSDRDHPSLVALGAHLAPIPVRRMDFPYRKAGRRAPDRAPVLVEAVRTELADFATELGVGTAAIVIGGRSMGGRMCSVLAAEGVALAGLVLICYPLHPPARPDRLRTGHLPQIRVPTLFVSGDRDPFGTPEELTAAAALVRGRVTHHWIGGGRHDLRGADDELCEVIGRWIRRRRVRPR